MCPAADFPLDDEAADGPPPPEIDAANAAADAEDAVADPMAAWAVGLARQQAVERGEEEASVDESFIARALAESRRMRQETGKSNQKRAANFGTIGQRYGEAGLSAIQAAMQEHAAEVLSPAQASATGLDAETALDAPPPHAAAEPAEAW